MHFLWGKIENIDFSRLRVTNCDPWADRFQTPKPGGQRSDVAMGAESEILIDFDVTLRYFFFQSPGILDTRRL